MSRFLGLVHRGRAASETVTISGTTAKTAAALPCGVYRVRAVADCYWRQGAYASITATVAAGHFLPAGEEILIEVQETGRDDGIAFITGGAGGSAYLVVV